MYTGKDTEKEVRNTFKCQSEFFVGSEVAKLVFFPYAAKPDYWIYSFRKQQVQVCMRRRGSKLIQLEATCGISAVIPLK